MNYYKISFLILIGFLTACQETVTDFDLPYKEQLVVRAILNAGEAQRKIKVEKTLHPLEEYDDSKFMVKDAIVKINFADEVYDFTFDGQNYMNSKFVPQEGTVYNFSAEWKGKKVIGETRVPFKPVFDSIYWYKNFTESEFGGIIYTFYTYVEPTNRTFYMGGIVHESDYIVQRADSLSAWNITNSNGKVRVVLGYFYNFDSNEQKFLKALFDDYYFVVTAYDEPYYGYYNTKNNGQSSSSIFGMEGTNVQWNVIGDGIGLFLGTAEYRKQFKY